MDILLLFVGYLIGKMNIRLLLNIMFNCFVCYVVFKIVDPSINVWTIKQYNIDNIILFISSGLMKYCLGCYVLVFLVFHVLFGRLFDVYNFNRRENLTIKVYSEFTKKAKGEISMTVKLFIEKFFKFISKYSFLMPHDKLKDTDIPTYRKFKDNFKTFFVWNIQALIFILFVSSNSMLTLLVFTIFCFVFWYSKAVPVLLIVMPSLKRNLFNEYNKHIKD